MGAIKVTPADTAFSKCVRERVNYTCERCGSQHDRSSKGLHCSHFHGRGNWAVRFDPDNAFSHCYGCHQHLGSRPSEFEAWVISQLGQGRFDLLRERSNDRERGRFFNRTKGKGEIAKYFREELDLMRALRDAGDTSRMEIEPFY